MTLKQICLQTGVRPKIPISHFPSSAIQSVKITPELSHLSLQLILQKRPSLSPLTHVRRCRDEGSNPPHTRMTF